MTSAARPSLRGREDETPPDRETRILGIIETARAKRPKFRDERITMAHGAGGKATQTLIEGLLVPALSTGSLEELGDSGTVAIDGLGLAMTTDSYVVRPIRFPGGSIGELAVNGTVNDLAVAGASSPSTRLRVARPPAPWAIVMRSSRNFARLARAVSMIPRTRCSRSETEDTQTTSRSRANRP